MSAIKIQNLCKTYAGPRGPVRALNDVSFTVEEGEFFGLLGPNGAGKTTLISILAGLVKASSGSIEVLGQDVARQPLQARRLLGIVPQELVYDPFFSVREALQKAEQSGWLEQDGAVLRPTARGFDFLSDLQALFLPED